jgi:hypothetical protein
MGETVPTAEYPREALIAALAAAALVPEIKNSRPASGKHDSSYLRRLS